MDWTAIKVITSSEAVEAVSYILTDMGAQGVQIEDAADFENLDEGKYGDHGEFIDPASIPHRKSGAAVSGYFPQNVFVPELLPTIHQRVAKLREYGLNPGENDVSAATVDNQQWATVWQKYYHPLRVTDQLTIVPQWEEYQPADPKEKLIFLDPGMAFGTGTHPTTRLMLEALEKTIVGNEYVIDVGTGSGVLSIAAKHLGAGKVDAYDIDEVAVNSAKKNLALNPIAKDVKVGVNSLLDGIHTHADLIVANILAEIIVPLIPQAYENLKPGGKFLVSGIIDDKAPLIRQKLQEQGFIIDDEQQMKDWHGMIAHKPTEVK
ncbi:50S ribosomal protein L11 methyltransferase [Limosilactobacillus reuteri]|uniref:50S ribosomal protein L11 methyltransferase n=1 Tax=Limosilactobacillus reuteri TaxID=1598 RepID=UPI001E58E196|nr:50S ribosomal protein L11 methyltransferase [Limosilactobacillus reuteri]MCC4436078.1 50S ribosomal protein L11 methyltransferase [Limosilactobacillus reuteri]MCC4438395.1 50S ribosomal protein L11 methyltransferase [Limosilactobacillus reuteri]MCC4442049.1 50S ribosomal protein L11 methyltransferase [Limosilactobacillus reuteri]MCC4443989.1 50S ribosomal protein L11 methyltransferase [Limosilactobacillus reuteri]MCC4446152.1 50S ribosomal protein L11 methyltransferase [Limosilactobacillus 